MPSFDAAAAAAQESWSFLEGALREIAELSQWGRPQYEANRGHDVHGVVWDSERNDASAGTGGGPEVGAGAEAEERDQYGIGEETRL